MLMLGSYSNEHIQIKESVDTDQDKSPVTRLSDRLLGGQLPVPSIQVGAWWQCNHLSDRYDLDARGLAHLRR
jgi:hypothetical protein